MPGLLVHIGAQVLCAHGGQAQPAVPNPRVLVSGQPTVLLSTTYLVAGCPFPPPPNGNGPCVTGQWLSGTTRVLSNGQPLAVNAGASLCAPTGTPMMAAVTQTRVTAL
ncbi:hypothetical protein FNU76_23080 [Chitinimonas arctica]|uniref:DUF4280 domain-containing protein n=1 Tax=Chitinimonas arctica TaxID=2594795 RepID=A0A516SLF2_9NEIS|nr:hypothetical protein [Chitinimonas arctica]QDQ28997.1 hypothetical protein FNU76_23080 [Chitinimonas arctica]